MPELSEILAGNCLAVVFDDRVLSPQKLEPTATDNIQVRGDLDQQRAEQLARESVSPKANLFKRRTCLSVVIANFLVAEA